LLLVPDRGAYQVCQRKALCPTSYNKSPRVIVPPMDKRAESFALLLDQARILGEMVRGTVEETLDAMLDAETDQLSGAGRYERSHLGKTPGLAATKITCRIFRTFGSDGFFIE
jgi:hypothetical protein